MAKRIATAEDLEKYPVLAQAGLKVGDEFEIPDEALNSTNEENSGTFGGDAPPDPPPGGNNPTTKPPIP